MKSLQQQIQVLSTGGYGMQPLLFPCVCSQQPPRPAVIPAGTVPPLYPAVPPPPATAAPPLYQPLQPPRPAAAAADLNPNTVAAGGAPGSVPGMIGIGTGLGEEMAWSTSELPFGGCARCRFRRRAGDC
nr:uncharacterized protein LOC127348590 [Lolium perenne]